MRKRLWFVTIATATVISLFISACNSGTAGLPPTTTPQNSPQPAVGQNTPPSSPPASTQVQDHASLIDALKKGGATVSSGDAIQQPFLSVAGQTITVNGGAVQTFEYSDANAMSADASKIGPDGTIMTTSIMWVAQPHFYKAGRLLVIYPGTDAKVLDALKAALGEPFAVGANTVGTPLMQP